MDPSSIITQVKRPSEESLCPGSKEAQLSTLHEGHKGDHKSETIQQTDVTSSDSDSIVISVDEQHHHRLDAGKSPHIIAGGGGGGGGGGGSRFLSQLFCCFGLGHAPDHAAMDAGGSAAEAAYLRSVAHHRHAATQQQQQQQQHYSKPHQQQLPPSSKALTNGVVDDYGEADEQEQAVDALSFPPLLAPPEAGMVDRICAVIDLDETLVHSSFRCSETPDFAIQVEVDGVVHQVYVLKRPFADEFLAKMGELFECVLFTASMGKYADPVSDLIDPGGAFKHRLFREACVYHCDSYVKDLAALGRPVDRCVIIDNSPASYMFNTENAIQVQTWMGDQDDTELRDLLPYMEQLARSASVSEHLRNNPPPVQPPLTMAQVAAQMQQAIDEE